MSNRLPLYHLYRRVISKNGRKYKFQLDQLFKVEEICLIYCGKTGVGWSGCVRLRQ